MPYALIANSHLLADQMWEYPRTLFFPFSGRLDSWTFKGTPATMLDAYAEIVARPAILAVELVGMTLLGWLVRRGGLYRWQALKHLLPTDKIETIDGLEPCG